MLYREIQRAVDKMGRIHVPLRDAILAESTPEMRRQSEQAQSAVHGLIEHLEEALTASDDDRSVNRDFAQAALDALQRAKSQAQMVFVGPDVAATRGSLLTIKTQTDFAEAYLRAAIGVLEP